MSDPVRGALVSRFDTLLFDLDGVVYVGRGAVPHAAEVIASARQGGVSCAYVTNNAARPPSAVVEHLAEIGIESTVHDVITSPQAATTLLAQFVPAGSRVLVIGGGGIAEALIDRGYQPVTSLGDSPAAVMQGYSPDLTWRDLAEATFAVRSGLPWIATNPDLTFPTPRGVAPGNGALVRVVSETVGRQPDGVAGKPEPALLLEAISRTRASSALMIGDRLDTDIAAGSRVAMSTLLVFTGVATLTELMNAIPEERPTYLGADLRTLLGVYPDVSVTNVESRCGEWVAAIAGNRLELTGPDHEPAWDGVRAAAALVWRMTDLGTFVDFRAAVERMEARTSIGVDGYG